MTVSCGDKVRTDNIFPGNPEDGSANFFMLNRFKYRLSNGIRREEMKPVIDPKLCKGCNICVYICPKKCYSKGTEILEAGYFTAVVSAREKCYNHNRQGKLVCELCVMSCPDQAISWHEETEEEKKK